MNDRLKYLAFLVETFEHEEDVKEFLNREENLLKHTDEEREFYMCEWLLIYGWEETTEQEEQKGTDDKSDSPRD